MNQKQKDQYNDSLNQTLNFFKKGHSIPEIAYKRKPTFSTIENHFRKLLENGEIKLSELLGENKIKIIEESAENCDSLKEIKEKLSDDISYGEVTSSPH